MKPKPGSEKPPNDVDDLSDVTQHVHVDRAPLSDLPAVKRKVGQHKHTVWICPRCRRRGDRSRSRRNQRDDLRHQDLSGCNRQKRIGSQRRREGCRSRSVEAEVKLEVVGWESAN